MPATSASVPQKGVPTGLELAQHSVLSEASRLLAASLDYETTLATVARLSMPALGAWCIVDLLLEDGAMRRLAVVHPDPEMQVLARRLENGWPPERDDPFGLPVVMRTRKATVLSRLPDDVLEAASGGVKRLRVLKSLGMGSMMTVPMIARGSVLGAITFISATTGHQYTSRNLAIAEDLANMSAMAIDRAHLHRRAGKRSELGSALASARRARAVPERAVAAARSAQAQAETARRTAETANRAKGEFLANMSHELRTPLNAIAGFAELLALGIHGELGERQQDYVKRIQQSEQHLLELINSVLQYAQLEAGRLRYEMTLVPLPAALAYVEDMIGPQFVSAGLSLSCHCAEPIHARADREKLQQILLNLLSNALKFTPRGGRVSVGCESDADAVSIKVVDSGIGIPDDRLQAIFDPFVRVDHKLTRTTAGTGLGLAISRRHGPGDGCRPHGRKHPWSRLDLHSQAAGGRRGRGAARFRWGVRRLRGGSLAGRGEWSVAPMAATVSIFPGHPQPEVSMSASPRAQSHSSLGSARRVARSSPLRASAASSHVVQFYERDDYLSESIADFLADGVSAGQPVIAIATEPHLRAILYALQGKGIALGRARATGQLTLLDAEETLGTFMDGGRPDAARFRRTVGGLLEAAGAVRPGVTIGVYGEMVDVLWRSGNSGGAIRLEELWNDLAGTYSFSLVCGYGMSSFSSEAHSASLHAICRQHGEVIPTESYTQADEDTQPREIAMLQQRARALETEIERRRELERSLRKALDGAEAQRDALARLQRSQHHLLALINDLLNLSRAEAGRVELSLEEIAVGTLLSDVVRTIEPLLLAGRVTCSIDAESGGRGGKNDIAIRADRERVNQILLNLMTNAIKFTPAGGHVGLRATRHPTIQEMARIQVRDTGIGIPEAKLDSIFEPFVQLRAHTLGQGEGVGLGLAISRTLARAMGGDLTAESGAQAGATLTLMLPLA